MPLFIKNFPSNGNSGIEILSKDLKDVISLSEIFFFLREIDNTIFSYFLIPISNKLFFKFFWKILSVLVSLNLFPNNPKLSLILFETLYLWEKYHDYLLNL